MPCKSSHLSELSTDHSPLLIEMYRELMNYWCPGIFPFSAHLPDHHPRLLITPVEMERLQMICDVAQQQPTNLALHWWRGSTTLEFGQLGSVTRCFRERNSEPSLLCF